MRVLATSLGKEQIGYLELMVRNLDYRICDHARDRMNQKGVDSGEVDWCLKRGKIIEFNTNTGSRCVLLRDNTGVCVVVNLDWCYVVTVFRNNRWDRHDSLDQNQYNRGPVPHAVLRGETY